SSTPRSTGNRKICCTPSSSSGRIVEGSARSTATTSTPRGRPASCGRGDSAGSPKSSAAGEDQQAGHGQPGAGDHQQGHRYGGVLAAQPGDRGDRSGGEPLDEPEHRRTGAGMFGPLGGGQRAAVRADEALRGHQHQEADDGQRQRSTEPQRTG